MTWFRTGMADGSKVSLDLLKDTVGFIGKNKLKNDAVSSGIFTVNANKSITANGSLSETTDFAIHKGSDIPAGGYFISIGDGVTLPANASVYVNAYNGSTYVKSIVALTTTTNKSLFTIDYDGYTDVKVGIYVANSATFINLTLYPMIYDADISDSTYEPYHEDVEDTLRDAEVIEGKNLISLEDYKNFVTTMTNWNGGSKSYDSTTNILTVVSGNASSNSGAYSSGANVNKYLRNPILYPVVFSCFLKADKNCSYKCGMTSAERILTLPANTWVQHHQVWGENSSEFDFYSNDDNQPTVQIKDMMICTLEEWNKSHDYEPYYVPLKERKLDITDEQVLGAWNLASGKFTSEVVNAITFTVNSDNVVTIDGHSSISSGGSHIYSTHFIVKKGSYYFSSGNALDDLTFMLRDTSNNVVVRMDAPDNEIYFTLDEDKEVYMDLSAGFTKTFSGNTIYPMISLKPNMPYTPYCMTNRELTKDMNGLLSYVGKILTYGAIYDSSVHTKITGSVPNQMYLVYGLAALDDDHTYLSIIFKQGNSNATGYLRDFGGHFTNGLTFSSNSYDITINPKNNSIKLYILSVAPFAVS